MLLNDEERDQRIQLATDRRNKQMDKFQIRKGKNRRNSSKQDDVNAEKEVLISAPHPVYSV